MTKKLGMEPILDISAFGETCEVVPPDQVDEEAAPDALLCWTMFIFLEMMLMLRLTVFELRESPFRAPRPTSCENSGG